jgi:hypothetical protein
MLEGLNIVWKSWSLCRKVFVARRDWEGSGRRNARLRELEHASALQKLDGPFQRGGDKQRCSLKQVVQWIVDGEAKTSNQTVKIEACFFSSILQFFFFFFNSLQQGNGSVRFSVTEVNHLARLRTAAGRRAQTPQQGWWMDITMAQPWSAIVSLARKKVRRLLQVRPASRGAELRYCT